MKHSPSLLALVLAVVLPTIGTIACHSTPSLPSMPPEANRMQPDHAPTPFSADEIRAACPEGRWNLFEMQTTGKAKLWQLSTFEHSDEHGADFQGVVVNEEGAEVGSPARDTATWHQLQAHASFPSALTEIRADTYRSDAGKFDCWLYVVTEHTGDKEIVQRFWFARNLPGPPVRVEQREDGTVTFEMKLVQTGTSREDLR